MGLFSLYVLAATCLASFYCAEVVQGDRDALTTVLGAFGLSAAAISDFNDLDCTCFLNGCKDIKCDSTGRIREIDLSGRSMPGYIHADIGKLTALRKLRLENNQLSGTLPPELFIPGMLILSIARNRLTGLVPAETFTSDISVVDFSGNQFSGTPPTSLVGVSECDFSGNCFSPCGPVAPGCTVAPCNGCPFPSFALSPLILPTKSSTLNGNVGRSVALVGDGSWFMAGATRPTPGRVFLFNGTGSWQGTWQDRVMSTPAGDLGENVAVSADGSLGVVSVGGEIYWFSPKVDPSSFFLIPSQSGWKDILDLAVSDDGSVVIASYSTGSASRVAVFMELQAAVGGWQVVNHLTDGKVVAVAGDGLTVAVGEPLFDAAGANTGRVRIFIRGSVTIFTWTLLQIINLSADDIAFPGHPVSFLANSLFGSSIALSGNGDVLLASAPGHRSNWGAAFVFQRGTTSYSRVKRLFIPDLPEDSRFGATVAMKGDVAMVAAPGDWATASDPGQSAGFLYVFVISRDWEQVKRISGRDLGFTGTFNLRYRISLTSDGTGALIGASPAVLNIGIRQQVFLICTISSSCSLAPDYPTVSNDGTVRVAGDAEFSVKLVIPQPGTLRVTVSAKTMGWVAFGWSLAPPSHSLSDYVCWVSNSSPLIRDMWSNSWSTPTLDAKPGVLTEISNSGSGGRTTFVYERPFVTGDEQDVPVVDAPVWVQWAIGSDDTFSKHTHAGAFSMNLLDVAKPVVAPTTPSTSPPSSTNDPTTTAPSPAAVTQSTTTLSPAGTQSTTAPSPVGNQVSATTNPLHETTVHSSGLSMSAGISTGPFVAPAPPVSSGNSLPPNALTGTSGVSVSSETNQSSEFPINNDLLLQNGDNGGAIAAGLILSIAALSALGVLFYCFFVAKRRQSPSDSSNASATLGTIDLIDLHGKGEENITRQEQQHERHQQGTLGTLDLVEAQNGTIGTKQLSSVVTQAGEGGAKAPVKRQRRSSSAAAAKRRSRTGSELRQATPMVLKATAGGSKRSAPQNNLYIDLELKSRPGRAESLYDTVPGELAVSAGGSGGVGGSGSGSYVLPADSVQRLEQIGEGSFGVVYRGVWRVGGTTERAVAIKISKDTSELHLRDMMAEAESMQSMSPHPNLVEFLGVCEEPRFSLVLEYLAGGNLSDLLYGKSKRKFSVEEKRQLCFDIIDGVSHLHQSKVIHRDLACRNVLLDKNGRAKVSDFGFSRAFSEEVADASHNYTAATIGPVKFMAPEQLNARQYSYKSDMYSFGCVLFELFNETEPWPGQANLTAASKVLQGERLPFPPNVPRAVAHALLSCLAYLPAHRPSAAALKTSLRQGEWAVLRRGIDDPAVPRAEKDRLYCSYLEDEGETGLARLIAELLDVTDAQKAICASTLAENGIETATGLMELREKEVSEMFLPDKTLVNQVQHLVSGLYSASRRERKKVLKK